MPLGIIKRIAHNIRHNKIQQKSTEEEKKNNGSSTGLQNKIIGKPQWVPHCNLSSKQLPIPSDMIKSKQNTIKAVKTKQ